MPSSCVVFTTDSSYLFPTLVSAIQARSFCSRTTADVLILGIGLSVETIRCFQPICESEDVRLITVDRSAIENYSVMLARLYLDRLVPEEYEQFLYLDGDVQIHRSLDPLIETYVPPGHLMAANDPIAFLLRERSPLARKLARYFHSECVPEEITANYFNSGVLRIPRDGWSEVSVRALEHYKTHHKTARFPDQDALNVAAFGRRLQMSLAWNFPVFLRNAGLHTAIAPHITHFMASPKPWQGRFAPWDAKTVEPYRSLIRRHPSLASFIKPFSIRTNAIYKVQQYGKKMQEALIWGTGSRRRNILEYESNQSSLDVPRVVALSL